MTPEFIEVCSLDVGPLSDLANGTLDINGFGGVFSWPLGYIIIRVLVEGVWGYNEDQEALVIPDSTVLGSQVLVILGTPTINWFINVIKESEINELSDSLNGLRIAWLLACQWAELSIQSEAATKQTVDLTNLKEVFKMTKKGEIDDFSSKIIHDQMKTTLLGNNMHVMTQSLKEGDGPLLPHGLSVMNTYTEVIYRSKQVAVLKNLMTVLITITKGVKVIQVVAMNSVPPVEVVPSTLEELDEVQGIQWTKMLVERRREVFFQQLNLSGLEGSERTQAVACALLAEYHDISPWNLENLAVLTLQNMKSELLMMNPLKSSSEGFPHPWWMRSRCMWRRCW